MFILPACLLTGSPFARYSLLTTRFSLLFRLTTTANTATTTSSPQSLPAVGIRYAAFGPCCALNFSICYVTPESTSLDSQLALAQVAPEHAKVSATDLLLDSKKAMSLR